MGRPRKIPKKEIITEEVNSEGDNMNDVSGEVHTIITTRDNMNDNTGTEDNKDVIEKEDKKLINANVSLTI